MRLPPRLGLAVAAILVASCTTESGVLPPARPDPDSTTTTTAATIAVTSTTDLPTTTTASPRGDCDPIARTDADLPDGAGPSAISISVSQATFECADVVTVALAGSGSVSAAAGFAARQPGPLLLVEGSPDPGLRAEIGRLAPRSLVLGDGVDPNWFGDITHRPLRARFTPLGAALPADAPARVWLVSEGAAGPAWPAVWAAAAAAGDAALLLPPEADLFGLDEGTTELLRSAGHAATIAVGLDPDAAWRLDVVRSGVELPGGGTVMFPGRRLVAFYGNPTTPLLGVLGEQEPEEAMARLLPFALEYATDGIPTVPAFEIIATVASAVAGEDGNYSEEMDADVLRPWVETAERRGAYVILDLQPGRTDFLTQAKLYEDLLRQPHVGLALDPEWRLKPDQVHLRQVGTVDAAEINEVVDWLAALVRENGLPQKLLLLHQFNLEMIGNRDQVATPPELAVTIQMDGDGSPAAKAGTWSVLTATDTERFWWGWKNFFDEDEPMPGPEFVLTREPTVHLVSFQ